MKKLLALLAVLGMVSTASAGIMISGNQITDGVDVGDGLKAYTISLTSDTGVIRAVDVSFDGPLSQFIAGGMFTTPNMDYVPFLGDDAAKDSHFLFASSQTLTVRFEESETNLTGIFAWEPANMRDTIALAQIVIPDGMVAYFTGDVDTANGTFYGLSAPIGVPEPMTLSLLAVGVVGLLRRKLA